MPGRFDGVGIFVCFLFAPVVADIGVVVWKFTHPCFRG